MKRILPILLVSSISVCMDAQVTMPDPDVRPITEVSYPWYDKTKTDEQRISDLISEMSIDDKFELLARGGISRLGIKPHGSYEAIHGLVIGGPGNPKVVSQQTTAFPQGYGLGETWDRDLIHVIGKQMGTEARAIYNDPDAKCRKALVLWAPNADIGRDPRWGRTEECFGEDPYLVGVLSASMISGMQGDDDRYWMAASLMKHFLANSNEDERTRTSSDIDNRLWREYYSYGFYKGFTEGGGSSYMAAYNKLNGIPCTVHPMLKDIIANEWGVEGIVSTDGGAFGQLLTEHHYYDNLTDAAAACFKNGVNQFLDRFLDDAKEALNRSLISESDIDNALRGRIRVMLKLGLLDAPEDLSNPYLAISGSPWDTDEARALARLAADKSVVLLKNDNNILPLNAKDIKRIAVIGNKADTVYADWYGGEPPYRVSPLQAIHNVADPLGIEVRYVKADVSSAAAEAARWADVAIVCVGNHPCTANDYEEVPPWGVSAIKGEGREAADRQSLQLDTEDLIRIVHKANPRTIVALISSFPYAINWTAEHVDGIVHCTQSSQELGNALTDVIFGMYNPAGRLTQTWPRGIEDLPDLMDYDIANGRTYMYTNEQPLYDFGYGLSYTTFEYSNLDLQNDGDSLLVKFTLTNTGQRDGEEVPQVYVSLPGDDAKHRLKAFDRIALSAGEKKNITLSIPHKDLQVWDTNLNSWTLPRGSYEVKVSKSSSSPMLTSSIEI